MSDYNLDDILSGLKVDGSSPYVQAEKESWNDVLMWIPTGCISLDYAIAAYKKGRRGGIPIGKSFEISGLESTGKSALLDHMIRETLKAGGAFFLCDPEHSHTPDRLTAIGVGDMTNLRFMEKPRDAVIDQEGKKKKKSHYDFILEEFFETAEKTIIAFRKKVSKEIPIVMALDSLAAIKTKTQVEAEKEGMYEGFDTAKQMKVHFAELCALMAKSYGSIILVNQLRVIPGVQYGDIYRTPGGDCKNFAFSFRIRMESSKKIKVGGEAGKVITDVLHDEDYYIKTGDYVKKDTIGLLGQGKIVKNKLAEPFRTFRFPLMFQGGMSDPWCFAMMLIDRDKVSVSEHFTKDGNTYYWYDDKLGIGEANLARTLAAHPDLMKEMEEELFGDHQED